MRGGAAFKPAPRRVITGRTVGGNLERSTELHLLMLEWRRRLTPQQIPGLISAGRIRRQDYVSQEDMAWLTNVTVAWYGALERGRLDRAYSHIFLDRVAYSLRLSTGERRALYLLALGHEPPPRPYAPPKISAAVQTMLDRQPWPAYIHDAVWNILASNAMLHSWFPKIFEWEKNIMRLMFCYPECQLQMVDWETKHARLMLGQLRAQHAKMPDNEELKDLIADILENCDAARRLWEDEPHVYFHDDGDPRKLFLPDSPKIATEVEILSWTPLRNPDLRVTFMIPVSGYIPDSCQHPSSTPPIT